MALVLELSNGSRPNPLPSSSHHHHHSTRLFVGSSHLDNKAKLKAMAAAATPHSPYLKYARGVEGGGEAPLSSSSSSSSPSASSPPLVSNKSSRSVSLFGSVVNASGQRNPSVIAITGSILKSSGVQPNGRNESFLKSGSTRGAAGVGGGEIPTSPSSSPPFVSNMTSRSVSPFSSVVNTGERRNPSAIAITGNILKSSAVQPKRGNESYFLRWAASCRDPEEVKRIANELYKQGKFMEALALHERAISLSPKYPPYRSNRAATLVGLGRVAEAIAEFEEAIKLDPSFVQAHCRVASLYLRLGLVERSKEHYTAVGTMEAEWVDMHRIKIIEKHVSKCIEARKYGDWKTVIRESDAAVVSGADSAPEIFGYKAEALMKLSKLEEADIVLTSAKRLESASVKFGVTLPDSFLFSIRAQVDMALGRFEAAVAAAESAALLDPHNVELIGILTKVHVVCRARLTGNALFKAGRFFEACAAYGEGLDYDPMNALLLCNRAACRFKLHQWEKAVEDCTAALSAQSNYTKALLRRAHCHAKLEKWKDALRDYEVLSGEMPGDAEVIRGILDMQIAMRKSEGGDNLVEEVYSNDKFKEALSSSGLAVVEFNARWSEKCKEISPFVDQLCKRYPSANFLKGLLVSPNVVRPTTIGGHRFEAPQEPIHGEVHKLLYAAEYDWARGFVISRVDVDENPVLAKVECVSFVPMFKIYKDGFKVREIMGPSSQQALDYTLRQYAVF